MAEQVRSFSDGRFAECCTSADDSGGVDGGGLDESTSERRMYYLSTDI